MIEEWSIVPGDPNKHFYGTEVTSLKASSISDYWRWAFSDFLGNTHRGIIAEYIVAKALRDPRPAANSWEPVDVILPDGQTIEVKSSGYVQNWYQTRPSRISFNIKSKLAWNPSTNDYDGPPKRHADMYVFCLHKEMDRERVDPFDLNQWEFYVVKTVDLNSLYPTAKSVSLASIQSIALAISVETLNQEVKRLSLQLAGK